MKGKVLLIPQPDDSPKDALNWSFWRKHVALLSLGLYCMLCGGMSTMLVTAVSEGARIYDSSVTTLLISLMTSFTASVGFNSVIICPIAILFGQRPLYILSAILILCNFVWCALASNVTFLAFARVLQGIAVSAVECLPAVTIVELFFLHERAFRIGIYTFFLFGGKSIFPLVSAAVINVLEWRWAFWYVMTF